MCFNKSKCIILKANNEGRIFDEQTGEGAPIRFDPAKQIVALAIQELYVICVYTTSIGIYSLKNGALLDEKGKLDKAVKIDNYQYAACTVTPTGSDIYVASNNLSGSKKQVQSEVYQL